MWKLVGYDTRRVAQSIEMKMLIGARWRTGWNQKQRQDAGFKKAMLDPLTIQVVFLLHDTLVWIEKNFFLMLKMFSGSNRHKNWDE